MTNMSLLIKHFVKSFNNIKSIICADNILWMFSKDHFSMKNEDKSFFFDMSET